MGLKTTLNHHFRGGSLRKQQINLIDVFNIPDILLQRGFEEVTENIFEDTLINSAAGPAFKTSDCDFSLLNQSKPLDFLNKFSDKNFRSKIRNMVFGVNQNLSQEEYVFDASPSNEKRYANTVELLIAYLCVKELKALSSSFGVKIKNAPDGGDFDCIAYFQNSLFHFEIKSGGVKNIDESTLQSFLDRHSFLAPDASILFLDYQGGNKDDLDKLILKFKNLNIGAVRKLTQINKIQDGSRKFYTLDGDLMIVDLHNNEDILSNLRSAMQYFHRYNSHSKTMEYHLIEPQDLGYKGKILE